MNHKKTIQILLINLLFFCFFVAAATALESYRWESAWTGITNPKGIAVSQSEGVVYVVGGTASNPSIRKYQASDGKSLSWYRAVDGPPDRESGAVNCLHLPGGVAVNPRDGNIVIADSANSRLVKVSPAGTRLAAWGGFSRTPRGVQFYRAQKVSVNGAGNIYAIDLQSSRNARFVKLSADGDFLAAWNTEAGSQTFSSPNGIAVSADGVIHVADSGNNRIVLFRADGSFLRVVNDGRLRCPSGLSIGSEGNIYIADTDNHRIVKYDPNYNFISVIGGPGTGDGKFTRPEDVAVDGAGNIYVADTGNNRIQKFRKINFELTEELEVASTTTSTTSTTINPSGVLRAPAVPITEDDRPNLIKRPKLLPPPRD